MGLLDRFFLKNNRNVAWDISHRPTFQQLSLINNDYNGVIGGDSSNNYVELSKNIYAINKSIILISEIFSNAKIKTQDFDGNELDPCNLHKLLLKPNSKQNFEEYAKSFIRVLLSSGYVHEYLNSENLANRRRLDLIDSEKRPELMVLNSDFITTQRSFLWGLYNKELDNGNFKYDDGNYKIDYTKEDVIIYYDEMQDEFNPYIGVSRLQSLKEEILNIQLANSGKTNQIKLSGHTIVTPTQRKESEYSTNLDTSVDPNNKSYTHRDKLRDDLTNGGLSSNTPITVTNKELVSFNLMEGIKDINFDDFKREDVRSVMNLYQIPTELQGIDSSNSKYENRPFAQLEILENIVKPIAKNFIDSKKERYEVEDNIIFDYSHLPFYAKVKEQEEQATKNKIEGLIMLLNTDIKEDTKEKIRNKIDEIIENGI